MFRNSFALACICACLLGSVSSYSQNIFSQETFPNTYNTGGTTGFDGSFSGNQGLWNVITSANFNFEVDAQGTAPTPPNALRIFVDNAAASSTVGDNAATSPQVNLAFGSCQPASLAFEFDLRAHEVDNGNANFTLGLQFYDGSVWTTVWSQTSDWINDNIGEGNWETISVNVSNTYWLPTFQYRFYAVKNATSGGSNSTDLYIDDIQFNANTTGPAIPTFLVANRTQTAGSVNGTIDVGDEFTYTNVVTSPFPIKAVITVEALVNATIPLLDNDGAGISQRFQPQVQPSPSNMTADQTGYAQFKIVFKKMSDNSDQAMTGLRYRHFDVDGNTSSGNYDFREAGWVTGHSSILVNTPSDLTDNGSIIDAGPPNPTTWRHILGELVEHDGISSDPDVNFTALYGSITTIRVRLGYVFDKIAAGSSGNYTAAAREYGTEFGCFNLAQQSTLPVKLLSFSGSLKNNITTLNWTAENQVNFSQYAIERSENGIDYNTVGVKAAEGTGTGRQQYQYPDDISGAFSNVFYYRLKMLDIDGKYEYSNVIMVRKDQNQMTGVTINPNPVRNSEMVMVRMMSAQKGNVDISVVDMTGKVILYQQDRVSEGINSIALRNTGRLQAGMYLVRVNTGTETLTSKLSVIR